MFPDVKSDEDLDVHVLMDISQWRNMYERLSCQAAEGPVQKYGEQVAMPPPVGARIMLGKEMN